MTAPIIPGLNDHEFPAILQAAAQAGEQFDEHTIVRLPYAVSELFSQWLDDHYPLRKNKVLNHIRVMRGGKLNDTRWHTRMRGEGIQAEAVHYLFRLGCHKANLITPAPQLYTATFHHPQENEQLTLFTT